MLVKLSKYITIACMCALGSCMNMMKFLKDSQQCCKWRIHDVEICITLGGVGNSKGLLM